MRKSCHRCQVVGGYCAPEPMQRCAPEPVQSVELSSGPWQNMAIDVLSPLPYTPLPKAYYPRHTSFYQHWAILISTRFLPAAYPVWNSLPLEAVNAQSLSVYKATVNSFLFPTA